MTLDEVKVEVDLIDAVDGDIEAGGCHQGWRGGCGGREGAGYSSMYLEVGT